MIRTPRERPPLRALRIAKIVVALVLLGILFAGLLARPAHAKTFTVTNTNVSGAGSLDQAIRDANNNNNSPTIDTIKFNIPTTDPGFGLTTPGVFTISSTSALPQITEPLTIDGYSQPGASPNTLAVGNDAVLKIELRRTVAGPGSGLWISTKNTTVKGLVINRWEEGVRISGSGATGNKVQGNFLGTDASGTQDPGDSLFGVIIDGSSSPVSNNTIGGDTPARRNIISANNQSGVAISFAGATGNKVMGNFIGTDKDGTADLGNTNNGVFVHNGAANNIIGGTKATMRNIISGNNNDGVLIEGSGATGNRVMGNYLGTDVTGTLFRGNTHGVVIDGAPNNTIGGPVTRKSNPRNVISENNGDGVRIEGSGATGNRVMGNYLGTDKTGTLFQGNNSDGVDILASNNTVGGTTASTRNIISGNGQSGVAISNAGATGNKVMGNYLGTDKTGTQDLGNAVSGVSIFNAPDNTIGGTSPAARNIISGNNQRGIAIEGADAKDNKVRGNFIGTDASGTQPLGNSLIGVATSSAANNNTIGGTEAGAGNLISYNGRGVGITTGSTGNRILSNSINNNVGLGIDLGDLGVTNNDAGDGDIGPNNLQNYPVLTSAKTTKLATTIKGTLNSSASTTFTIQFFSSPAADPSGNGEGQKFKGSKSVTTDSSGDASFTFKTKKKVPKGQVVTATATNQSTGDTSEFSVAIVAS